LPSFQDYVKLMTSRQPPAQVTGMSREPGGQNTGGASKVSNPKKGTSTYSPWTQSHGSSVAVVTPMYRHTHKNTTGEPSLGAQYQQAIAEDTVVGEEEPTVPSNGFTNPVWEDDDDLPAPPEMTMTLQVSDTNPLLVI